MANAFRSSRNVFENASGSPRRGLIVARVLSIAILGVAAAAADAQSRSQRSYRAPASFERTIFVSPIPGDPAASGERLLSAVRSISPSPEDPWLVKIEPGLFDLGTESLELSPGLEIEGSGRKVTHIQGLGQSNGRRFDRGKGVINGAHDAVLRELSVRCVSDEAAGRGQCICIANVDSSPELANLTLESSGFGNHWGIRNTASSPRIENLEIRLEGGTDNYGVVNASRSFPTILRSTILASGGSNLNVGVLDREGGGPVLIEDSQIFAFGGLEAIGIFEIYEGPPLWVTIDDGVIEASGAESNTGILSLQHAFKIQGATISGDVALDLGESGMVDVTSSELVGSVAGDVVWLGSTRLSAGSTVAGFSEATCAGVYVLSEPVEFFAEACPGGAAAKRAVSSRHGLASARRVAGGELG